MTHRISACVIARDEEVQLQRCLEALKSLDETVVLLDARAPESMDVLAESLGARVSRREYDGDIEQKCACVARAENDWVFLVDPDESVPEALLREVRRAVETADHDHRSETSGFEVNRRTHHLGRWIRFGDFYPDWKLRLFRRSRARFVGRNPHGRVEIAGRVARLEEELLHYSYRDLADQVDRIQFFSRVAAEALHAEGRRARVRDWLLRPPARFLRAYVLKQGFRDGVPGFFIAVATAFNVFLKYAKLWELERRGADSFGPPR
ncbi:MAG: glycosyltransferase family 2 protein [Myxococcota bacterium]